MRGGSMPVLAARSVLDALERHDDLMELDASVLEAVQRMDASAQGEAGDAKKYKAAKASMLRRWNLFLVVHGLTHEEEPTLEMMGLFDSFMYQFRQRGSLSSHSTASAVCPALYWLLQSKAHIFLCHTDANDASPPVLLTPSYCLSHNLQVWCHWHCKSTGPKKELT